MELENRMVAIHDINDPSDPYFIKDKTGYICCECKEYIQYGDDYVENENGEYIYANCIPSNNWIIGWLGYKIKKLEGNYD